MPCQETLPAGLPYSSSQKKLCLICSLPRAVSHSIWGWGHTSRTLRACHCQARKCSSCLLAVPLAINMTSSPDQTHDNENSSGSCDLASGLKVPGIKGDISLWMLCTLASYSSTFIVYECWRKVLKAGLFQAKLYHSNYKLWSFQISQVTKCLLWFCNYWTLCVSNTILIAVDREKNKDFSIVFPSVPSSFFLFYNKSTTSSLRTGCIAQ